MRKKIRKNELKEGMDIYTQGTLRKVTSVGDGCAYCDGWNINLRTDGYWGADDSSGYAEMENDAPAKYIVTYDLRGCGDPVEKFDTDSSMKKRVKELIMNSDVITESIMVYEVKNEKKVNVTFNVGNV